VPNKRPLGQKKNLDPNKALTRRQQRFVQEIVANDGLITKQEAALRAGYPVSSASQRAYELLNPKFFPNVVAAVERYQAELDRKFEVGYKRHVRDLQRIRDLALENGAYSAACMAEYRRGQAQGDIYVSKAEIRTGSIDQMSREDVERELNRIRKSFEPIDITPAAVEEQDSEGGAKPARVGVLEPAKSRAAKEFTKN
jgi:phage terminase small subunit